MTTRHCSSADLASLLNATSVTDETQSASEHIESCERCRRDLESLAAGDWWWSRGREWIADSSSVEVSHLSKDAGSASRIIAVDQLPLDSAATWSTDFLAPPTQPDLLGRLGKYHIESVIGHGGMGIVFRGFDSALHRTVAIKALAPHLASNATARKRFAREARAAAAVVHDHVVPIYGIESTGSVPYLVMPYIGGKSLQKYVDEHGPLDTTSAVRIAMQIAAGLAAAHEQGLVHRDIKPANILMENEGRVLITDFGLARAADDASITRSGLVAGTPHYMSPEQANGEAVDGRSDLFSLGSVIHFLAVGRPPFPGDAAMQVLHAICHKESTPLRLIDPLVPQPLEMLTQRLMAKAPQDRFASAADLRTLLAQYLAHLQNPTLAGLPRELDRKGSRVGNAVIATILFATVAFVGLCGLPGVGPNTGPSTSPIAPYRPPSGSNLFPRTPLLPSDAESVRDDFVAQEEFLSSIKQLNDELNAIEREWFANTEPDALNDGWDNAAQEVETNLRQLEVRWAREHQSPPSQE